MSAKLTADRARSRLTYDPYTGVIRWRRGAGRAEGTIAGTRRACGGIKIDLLGRSYFAQNLVWLISHGEWPATRLLFVNGDRSDLLLANLIQATPEEIAKRGPNRSNLSGYRGVSRSRGRYRATLKVGGKRRHLGCYATPAEAHAAYVRAKAEQLSREN